MLVQVQDLTQENTALKERIVVLEKQLDQKKVDVVNGGSSTVSNYVVNNLIVIRY
jgi:hypothetical protein